MKKFFRDLVQVGVIVFAIVAFLAVSIGLFMWPARAVTEQLESEGYRNVSLSITFWNRALLQCGGRGVSLYTYEATRDSKPVEGFACYRGFFWGVAHWDN